MAMYRCGGGSGVTPTPITPSDSSPAAMTSGVAYEPTANGYAIESYNNLYPSNEYTPGLIGGRIYKSNGGGFAIDHYTIKTPSNVTPPIVDTGDIIKIGGNEYEYGYLIKSYSSKTPDDTTPPSVTSGEIVKMGGTGYLYATQQSGAKVDAGTVTMATTDTKVTTGFKPKYIALVASNASSVRGITYDEDVSTTKFLTIASGSSAAWGTVGSTGNVRLVSVDNDGFTVKASSSTYSGSYNYFAIG